jgi:hypothetical protein
METVCSSETLASTYGSTRRQNPEEKQHNHNRLTVFENGMLRRIFGLKGEEVTNESKNFNAEEFYNV